MEQNQFTLYSLSNKYELMKTKYFKDPRLWYVDKNN